MLTNYKEYAMTRGPIVENGMAPDVNSEAVIALLEASLEQMFKQVDDQFALVQGQITGHVRVSMRNNQGTWNRLKNWWQTTWHGKDRDTVESTKGVENLRLELGGLISLHEHEVLSELMDIMEAGPINQAIAQMTPMLQNLQKDIKQRLHAQINSMIKKVRAIAAKNAQTVQQQPSQQGQPQNTPPPGNGPGSAGSGSAGAPPSPGGGASTNAATTGGGSSPNFGSHTATTGGGYDPKFGSHSASTGTSPWDFGSHSTSAGSQGSPQGSQDDQDSKQPQSDSDAARTAPGGHDPNGLTGRPAADPDDLHAAMDRPGGIDDTSDQEEPAAGDTDNTASGQEEPAAADVAAPTSRRERRRKRREKAPQITLGPESEDEDEDAPSSPRVDPYADADQEEEAPAPPEPNSLAAQVAALRAKLANRRSLIDDEDEEVLPPEPSTSTTTMDDDEEDDYFGSDVPRATAARERPADVERTGWREKIPNAIEGVQNPGIIAMAEKLAKPKGGGSSKDMAKFVYFMTQLMARNQDAKKILAMPDLADRYKDIAKKVIHPEHMGKVANYLNPGQLYPASENPAGFYGAIDQILQSQGIQDGVDMAGPKPRKKSDKPKQPPKPRASRKKSEPKKMRAESLQEVKDSYLIKLREAVVLPRTQTFLDLSHLPFSERIQAYRLAMKKS